MNRRGPQIEIPNEQQLKKLLNNMDYETTVDDKLREIQNSIASMPVQMLSKIAYLP